MNLEQNNLYHNTGMQACDFFVFFLSLFIGSQLCTCSAVGL